MNKYEWGGKAAQGCIFEDLVHLKSTKIPGIKRCSSAHFSDFYIWRFLLALKCCPFQPSFKRYVRLSLPHLSHPSTNSTVKLRVQFFVWSLMTAELRRWSREYSASQWIRITWHTSALSGSFRQPSKRLKYIRFDIITPLPVLDRCRNAILYMDIFIR